MRSDFPTAYSIFKKNIELVELNPYESKLIDKFVERYSFARSFVGFEMTHETKLSKNLQASLYKVLLSYQALAELFSALKEFGYTELEIDEVTCANEAIFWFFSENEQFVRYLTSSLGEGSTAITAINKAIEHRSSDVIGYARAISEVFALHKSNSRYIGLRTNVEKDLLTELSDFVLTCCDLHFFQFTNWLHEQGEK